MVLGRSMYVDRSQFWWQVSTAATVFVYLASLAFIHRPPNGYSSIWDGWVGNIACTMPIYPPAATRSPLNKTTHRVDCVGVRRGLQRHRKFRVLAPRPKHAPDPVAGPERRSLPLVLRGLRHRRHLDNPTTFVGARILSARLDGAIAGIAAGAVAAICGSTRF